MLDKAYIFSVAPYIASKKQFGFGPTVHIAAKPEGERYSVTEVPRATCYKDFGEGQREEFPVDPMDMVKDLENECTTFFGKQGVWGGENPIPDEKDIVAAEKAQRDFYIACAKDADSIWARYGDPGKIPFHAMIGARELNLKRDWAKDTSSMEPCKVCRELVSPDAAKCNRCGAILDWEKAIGFGLVTKEMAEFAKTARKAQASK